MSHRSELFKNPLAEWRGKEGFSTTHSNFYQQIDQVGDIVAKHDKITTLTSAYRIERDTLTSASNGTLPKDDKYKDFEFYYAPDDLEKKKKTTPNANDKLWLDMKDRKPDVKDAEKEDIHTMIVQQNNAHIMGMITFVTILIVIYITLKK